MICSNPLFSNSGGKNDIKKISDKYGSRRANIDSSHSRYFSTSGCGRFISDGADLKGEIQTRGENEKLTGQ